MPFTSHGNIFGVNYVIALSDMVCPPGWAHRMSPKNNQFQALTQTTELGELAPIAEDARDPGPHPVRHDAPLVEAARQPNCPTPEEVARHELTHLFAAS